MTKILGGHSPDLRSVKHNVKNMIWELEIRRWKAGYHIYPELNMYYESTSGNKIHAWHKYLNNHPHMYVFVGAILSIMCGSQPIGLQTNFQSKLCKLCVENVRDSPAHILFQCPSLQNTRESLWAGLAGAMPSAMRSDIETKGIDERANIIITCFGGSFVPEWSSIYTHTVMFVYHLYKSRYYKYADLEAS